MKIIENKDLVQVFEVSNEVAIKELSEVSKKIFTYLQPSMNREVVMTVRQVMEKILDEVYKHFDGAYEVEYGGVIHAHGIGNNKEYPIYLVESNRNQKLRLGSVSIVNDMFGSEYVQFCYGAEEKTILPNQPEMHFRIR